VILSREGEPEADAEVRQEETRKEAPESLEDHPPSGPPARKTHDGP